MSGPGSSSFCEPAVGGECAPVRCRSLCALEAIDQLLRTPGAVSGEETDRLLDFRWQVRKADDPETTLRLFCELRLRLEHRHYLAFFRIRRWLENHLRAEVRICPAAAPATVPVALRHYCVEAIRRMALCAALGSEGVLLAPRLEFRFLQPPSVLRLGVGAQVSLARSSA